MNTIKEIINTLKEGSGRNSQNKSINCAKYMSTGHMVRKTTNEILEFQTEKTWADTWTGTSKKYPNGQ